MYACLPSDLNPIFCVRLFVFVFRLMDVEHSQPPTHAHAYINTYAHTHTHTLVLTEVMVAGVRERCMQKGDVRKA